MAASRSCVFALSTVCGMFFLRNIAASTSRFFDRDRADENRLAAAVALAISSITARNLPRSF